jgi:hypothetical protein
VSPATAARRKLGEILVDDGFLSGETLQRALSAQNRSGHDVRIGGILLGGGVLPERALLETLSRLHRCPAVEWGELSQAQPIAYRLLPPERAYRLGAFPFALDRRTLRVAFVNPSDLAAIDEVAAITECRIAPAVTSEVRLLQAHEKFYSRSIPRQFETILKRLDRPEQPPAGKPVAASVPPPPALREALAEPEDEPEEAAIPFLIDPPAAPKSIVIEDGSGIRPLPDPFSDAYSLADFVADALAFGAPAREIFEGGSSEALLARLSRREEAEDLGKPLAPGEDLDDTRPSTRRVKNSA